MKLWMYRTARAAMMAFDEAYRRLGRFLGYLDNIFNFEFGTTRSSQKKDDTILNLTK